MATSSAGRRDRLAPVLSEEVAWPLANGSDLVVQLHLRPTGHAEDVAPTIGIYFTDRPPAKRSVMLRLGKQGLAIPAGARDHRVEDAFVLPVDADVLAVQPHAHFRAREAEAWATLPDRSRRPLLRIADWDARWQERYQYRAPVHLPAGTRILTTYVFDNSAANPRNPVQPPALAEWGWRTSDEMGDVWFQMVAATETDRARLQREARQRMLSEDAIGCELLLRREPDHVPLRNDTALIYMALGRPAEALIHFCGRHQDPARFRVGLVQRGRRARSIGTRGRGGGAIQRGPAPTTALLGGAEQPGRALDACRRPRVRP